MTWQGQRTARANWGAGLKQAAEAARLLLLAAFLVLLDGEVLAGGVVVLLPDLVGDEAVLGLLGRALVVLRALLEDLLLHPVDALGDELARDRMPNSIDLYGTLVKGVLLPLGLLAAAGQVVQLVHETVAGGVVLLLLLLLLLAVMGLVMALFGLVDDLVEEIHCDVWSMGRGVAN